MPKLTVSSVNNIDHDQIIKNITSLVYTIIYNGYLLIFSPFTNHIVIKYTLFLTLYLINLHYAIMIADSLHFSLLSHCSIYVVPAALLINSHCVIIIMLYFNYNVFSNNNSLYFQTLLKHVSYSISFHT